MRWRYRRGELDVTRPAVMAILNVTPDSFSDGGVFWDAQDMMRCVKRAETLLEAGAGILDIGGESTHPRAVPVSEEQELLRVIPALCAIRQRFPEAILSVDTTKPVVANVAAEAGADIINDVSGLCQRAMRDVVRQYGLGVVIMDDGGGECVTVDAPGIGKAVAARLAQRVDTALGEGIACECICIDPGFGFGKRHAANWRLLEELPDIVTLGYPVLVGGSRKHFIAERYGNALDEGGAAFARDAIARGVHIIRAHCR